MQALNKTMLLTKRTGASMLKDNVAARKNGH